MMQDEIEDISESEAETETETGRAAKRPRVETEDDYLDLFAEQMEDEPPVADWRAASSVERTERIIDLTVSKAPPAPEKTPAIDPSLAPFLVRRKKPSAPKSTAKRRAPKGPREDGLPHSINEWPGAAAVSRVSGISSVTCVDPGTRNLAIMRMEFAPSIRITHVHVLDLDQLRQHYQTLEPEVHLIGDGGKGVNMQSRLYALAKYVKAQATSGGCFDSDMCLVEEQSFFRVMSRVETTIVAIFNSVKPAIRLLEQDGGSLPAARSVSARTIKTCYRPLFPMLPSEKSSAGDKSASVGSAQRRRAFGGGDVHGNQETEKQHRENKKNAVKYGTMIVAQDAFERLVPRANLTTADVDRLKRRKMDDLYDTLFMCSYFLSTWMFEFYKIRRRGTSRPLPAHEVPGQRKNNRFEELVEICGALGSDCYDVQLLIDALTNEAVQLRAKN